MLNEDSPSNTRRVPGCFRGRVFNTKRKHRSAEFLDRYPKLTATKVELIFEQDGRVVYLVKTNSEGGDGTEMYDFALKRELEFGGGVTIKLGASAGDRVFCGMEKRKIEIWYGRLEDAERFPDMEYWRAQSTEKIFETAWEMVLEAHALKGEDLRESRLQRSVTSFQKRKR